MGSVARYLVSVGVVAAFPGLRFPLATLLVNVAGCLFIGLMAGIALRGDALSSTLRLFLFTGLAGGFTTFSAFGLETLELLRHAEYRLALAYVALSLCLGLLAVGVGFFLAARPSI